MHFHNRKSLSTVRVCFLFVENKPMRAWTGFRELLFATGMSFFEKYTPSVPGGPGNTQVLLLAWKFHVEMWKSSALGKKKVVNVCLSFYIKSPWWRGGRNTWYLWLNLNGPSPTPCSAHTPHCSILHTRCQAVLLLSDRYSDDKCHEMR